MKRVKLIYNPKSGKGKILKNLDTIFKHYQDYGYVVDTFRLSEKMSEESEKEKLLENIEEYHHILVSGGDGTINSIVNFFKSRDIDIPIAILPTGTANDFANILGIPSNISKACLKILNSEIKEIDLGKINDQYFVNIASVGVFSTVSQSTDRGMVKKLGKLAYVLNGIKEMRNLKKMKMLIESKEYSGLVNMVSILVFNGKSAGSFELAYNATLDDGYFDVLILKPDFLGDVPEMMKALAQKNHLEKEFPSFKYFKTQNLKLVGNDVYHTDIDGEVGPDLPIEITCIPKGLKILGLD